MSKKSKISKKPFKETPRGSDISSKRRSWSGVISLPIVVAVIGLIFQFTFNRPRVTFLDVKEAETNPFQSMFTITNVGHMNARNFQMKIRVDMVGANHNVFKDVQIAGFSPIENIEILPNQPITFDLDKAIHLEGINVMEATVAFSLNYTDFFFVPYSENVSYRVFQQGNSKSWRVVGPKYKRLFE